MNILLVLLLALGAVQPEVRNVRLHSQLLAGDTLAFRIQWTAPPRGRLASPVTGYEYQLLADGQILRGGSLNESVRSFEVRWYHDCAATPSRDYVGRVRALGAWPREDALWTASDALTIACDNTPPTVPPVSLDTIPADTTTTGDAPDSVTFALRSMDDGTVTWDGQNLAFTALRTSADLCPVAWRDGTAYRAASGDYDALQATESDAVEVHTTAEGCYRVIAAAVGTQELCLCASTLQTALPSGMKYPLMAFGLGTLLWGFRGKNPSEG